MRSLLLSASTKGIPVAVALGLTFSLFEVTGFDSLGVASGIVEGALTGPGALSNTFRWAVPLILMALGIAVSLRAGEFNIGTQGQLLVGSLATVWVALEWEAPAPAVILVATLVGVIAGAMWSSIAGVLKVRLGADEVITTLMLNLVSLQVIQWAATGPLKDLTNSGDSASTPRIDPALRLQESGRASPEILILTSAIIIAVWVLMNRSRLGFHIRYVGTNPSAARWQGMSIARIQMSTYLIAGGLAGLAGAMEVLGPAGRVVTGSTPTLGFSALVVATVAGLGVPGTAAVAILAGAVQAAVLYLPIVSDVPVSGLRIGEGLLATLITAQVATVLRRRRNPTTRGRVRADRRHTLCRSRRSPEHTGLDPATGRRSWKSS